MPWGRVEKENEQKQGSFPGGLVVKNPPPNAGDTGSIPDPDPTHLRATKPMCHNYGACVL